MISQISTHHGGLQRLASKAMELTMLRSRLRMGFVSPTDPAGLDVFWQKKTWEQPRFPWIFLGCSLDFPWTKHKEKVDGFGFIADF